MARKKRDKSVEGVASAEESLEEVVTDEIEETVVAVEAPKEVVVEEVVAISAPVVKEEFEIGDKISINLDLPKFKGKEFPIIEVGNGTVFVRVNGTKYGFKKERISKVG